MQDNAGGVAQSRASMATRAFWLAGAGLVVLFLLVRMPAIMFLANRTPPLDSEEYYYGMIGREILNGPLLPLFDYQPSPKCGGAIFLGYMVAAVFSVAGTSYAALKLAGVLCALAGALLWFMLISGVFGRRAALWYLLGAVFLPPGLLVCSLTVNGKWSFPDIYHAVGLLLLCGVINRLARPRPSEDGSVPWGTIVLFMLGALMGVGIFIQAYFFIFCAYAFLVLIGCRILNSVSRVVVLGAGFLIGLAPRIMSNVHLHYWRLGEAGWNAPMGRSFFRAAPSVHEWVVDFVSNFVRQLISVVLVLWPQSWTWYIPLPRPMKIGVMVCYEVLILSGAVLAAACLRGVSRRFPVSSVLHVPPYPETARRSGRIILGFFAFALGVSCGSQMGLFKPNDFPAHRYLLPLLPGYVLALAVLFDRLTLSLARAVRVAGWLLAAVFVVLMASGSYLMLPGRAVVWRFRESGYDYGSLARRLYAWPDKNAVLARAERLRDRQDRDDLTGVLLDMYWFGPVQDRCGETKVEAGKKQFDRRDVATIRKFAEKELSGRYRPAMYRAMGRGIAWSHGGDSAGIRALAGALEPGGIGRAWRFLGYILLGRDDLVMPPEARFVWQGIGSVEAWRRDGKSEWLARYLRRIPRRARGPFCEGVGAFWGFGGRENGYDFRAMTAGLPKRLRVECERGADIGFIRRPFVLDY